MEEENANYPIEFPAEPQPGAPTNLIIVYISLVLAIIGIGLGGFVFYKTSILDKEQKNLSEELKSVSGLVSAIKNENQEQQGQEDQFNSGGVGSEIQESAPIIEEDTVSSRDKTRKQDLKTIAAGLEKYKIANQSYPISQGLEKLNNFEGKIYKALVVGGHLAFMPKDPLDSEGRFYGYKSTADGKGYQLTASLEDKNDSEGKANGSLWLYVISSNYSETQAQSNLPNKSDDKSNETNSSNSTSGDSGDEEASEEEDEEDDSEEENFELESGDETLE